MKLQKEIKSKIAIVRINDSLNKYNDMIKFPDKMEKPTKMLQLSMSLSMCMENTTDVKAKQSFISLMAGLLKLKSNKLKGFGH
jgi:hypothetical protein